jgi:hypothetical protein
MDQSAAQQKLFNHSIHEKWCSKVLFKLWEFGVLFDQGRKW